MRRADVARGVGVVRISLLAAALDAAPVAVLEPGDVVAAPDMLLGALLLGALLLGALLGAPLEASVFVAFDMPGVARVESLARVVVGRLRSTSPVDVLVTLRVGEALSVDRTQSVVMAESVLAALAPTEALSRVVGLVDGVGPVPFAPFVVFSPLKRCSGLVAVLRVESVVAPAAALVVAADVLGLIVVVAE